MDNFFDRTLTSFCKKISIDHLIIFILIILAILTRVPGLGTRVMSHDEVNHVVPSFDLYSGRGYRHDPVTHGPLQFHLISFSYFLIGDNDFSSRLPHAIFSILTVTFVSFFYRRYIGRIGAYAAAFLFIISPLMMFYGRYARNEALCIFFNTVTIYTVLRFLEERKAKFIYLTTAALSLNFTSKETAYIFSLQILILLFLLIIRDIVNLDWGNKKRNLQFLIINTGLVISIGLLTAVSVYFAQRAFLSVSSIELDIGLFSPQPGSTILPNLSILIFLLRTTLPVFLPLISALVILQAMSKLMDWELLERSNSFPLFILVLSYSLPLTAPFLVRFSGIDPTAYSQPFVLVINYLYIAFLFGLSAILSARIARENWWKYFLLFFGIYITLYSTFFTNPAGIMTGMIGSLGHWLAQQDVQRGGQPFYYYFLIILPIYEFLSIFGSFAAFGVGIRQKSFWAEIPRKSELKDSTIQKRSNLLLPVPAIFLYWTITSLIAFTLAGEKMPWLTLHIAFSMLLTTGWVFNYLFKKAGLWGKADQSWKNSILIITGLLISALMLLYSAFGNHPPFQGKTVIQLQDTNRLIFFLFIFSAFIYLFYRFLPRKDQKKNLARGIIILFIFLSLLTFRNAYRASFINFDYPLEFLVYAHAADGPKIVLEQIETISRRTTQGLGIKVAYDNHGLYPYWWYLRNYPNKIVYLDNPTRSLEEASLIIAGSDKYGKLEPIVRDNYIENEYFRLWWPMQDYWNLNWDRIREAFSSGEKRQALFNIWLNRDFSLYADVYDNDFLTLENWLPSDKMKFYIRKDIAAQMWDMAESVDFTFDYQEDPYKTVSQSRQSDFFFGFSGANAGDLSAPRGIAIAPDGTIFVADSQNHRIQQFSKEGKIVNTWGSYSNILETEAPGGTFHEPWDVAVNDEGYVFVADTFNHRIQKFSKGGTFIKSWGVFAQGNEPDSFWGPRGIAIGPDGLVYVTDTGNKRVVVFDEDLNFVTQFGGTGFEPGKFDEPVGIEVDNSGNIYVADTWNRRIQIFEKSSDGGYIQISEFDIEGWYGQSIENKPYLTVSPEGNIYASDPEGGRILVFSQEGEILHVWQDLAVTDDLLSFPYGLDVDPAGNLWVADGFGNLILRFDSLPE